MEQTVVDHTIMIGFAAYYMSHLGVGRSRTSADSTLDRVDSKDLELPGSSSSSQMQLFSSVNSVRCISAINSGFLFLLALHACIHSPSQRIDPWRQLAADGKDGGDDECPKKSSISRHKGIAALRGKYVLHMALGLKLALTLIHRDLIISNGNGVTGIAEQSLQTFLKSILLQG